MKTNTYTVQIIEPNDGYKLTLAADVEVAKRIISNKIYLAINDSADNYKEITDAEANEILEYQRLLAEAEEAKEAENAE